jgi:hypothetical protein
MSPAETAVIPGHAAGVSLEAMDSGGTRQGAARDRLASQIQRIWIPGSSLRDAPE